MRLKAVTAWRYPDAEAMSTADGEWYVRLGERAEEVLPLGVEQSQSEDWLNRPKQLDATLHDAFESLCVVDSVDDPERRAELLACHCRRFPAPILCRHGLPELHPLQHSCRDAPRLSEGMSLTLWLDDVLRMLAGLSGIESLAHHLAHQRTPARPRLVENALLWPVIDEDFASQWTAQARSQGELPVNIGRFIVASFVDSAFTAAGVRLTAQWTTHRRPELVLESNTHLGLYLVDFARTIGITTYLDQSFVCTACGLPFTPAKAPQPGKAIYCTAPQCQRERKRINQRNSRAQRKSYA